MNSGRVMIIDADISAAESLEESLSRSGYYVTSITSRGSQAIDRIPFEHPDIVVTDIVLQGIMDGIETAKIIRQRYGIPVVFLFDGNDHDIFEKTQAADPCGFLVKPLSDLQLKATIDLALKNFRTERDSEMRIKALLQRELTLKSLYQSSKNVIEFADFTQAARSIFDACKEMTGASAGYVALLSEDKQENIVLFLDASGRECTVDPTLPMPVRGFRGEAFRSKTTVYENDFATSPWMKFMPEGHVRLDNVMFIPLNNNGEIVGLMGLANKPGGFNDHDAELASAFGELASIALKNSKLVDSIYLSEKKYKNLVESLPYGIHDCDLTGRITFCNRSDCDILGYSAKELTGMTLFDITADDLDKKKLESLLTNMADSLVPPEKYQTTYRKKNGGIIHAEVDWSYRYDQGGNLTGFRSFISDISSKINAENDLKRTQAIFKAAMEQSPAGITITDKDLRIEYVNPSGLAIAGRESDKSYNSLDTFVGGLNFLDFEGNTLIKSDIPLVEAITTGCNCHREYILRKNGNDHAILSNAAPIFDDNGEIIGGVSVFLDISEKKAAEETILENERLLRTIAENYPNSYISIIESDYTISFSAGQEFKKQYLNKEFFSGKPLEFVFGNHADFVKRKYEQAFEGKEVQFELFLNNQFQLYKVVPLFYNNGSVKRILSAGENITERKKAELELKKHARLIETLFTKAPIGMALYEIDSGNMLYVNETFLDAYKIPRNESQTVSSFLDYVYAGRKELRQKLVKDSLSGDPKRMKWKQLPIVDKDKTITYVDAENMLLEDQNLIISLATDVTEQKRMNEQLQMRERMDSIGTLAGGIAHDFNNLLMGIIGNLDLVRMEYNTIPAEQQEKIEDAYSLCHKSARLIEDLQSLTRHTVTKSTTAVDVNAVAQEVVSILERTTDKLIEKNVDIIPDTFFINGQHDLLHQIFLNLGTNAVQAIEEKGVCQGDYIRISACDCSAAMERELHAPEGSLLHITFEDTGCGMSDDVKKRAFEPLFSTKERSAQKGQGLGLAMVYNIVTKNLNGYISIDTSIDKGAKFHIFLPKSNDRDAQLAPEALKLLGGSETILLIEDETPVCTVVSQILRSYGYAVSIARDGQAGVNLFKERHNEIDLVILDLTLPKLSGIQVFDTIRNIKPDMKIMISSGHIDKTMPDEFDDCVFLAKPYKLEDFVHTVRLLLDNKL